MEETEILEQDLLKTDFKDSILSGSMDENRRFRMIYNDDGTVSFKDVTEYEQVGDEFGATQLNKITERINENSKKTEEKLDAVDVVDPTLATEEGFAADAKLTGEALSELNSNLKNISKAQDAFLGTKTWNLDNVSIAAGEASTYYIDIPVSGYIPIAARSWQIASATTNGGGPSLANVYGIVFGDNRVGVKIRNIHTVDINIRINVNILYAKEVKIGL